MKKLIAVILSLMMMLCAVSAVAESGSGETTYKVLADFVPDSAVKFGMSVVVTTLEDAEEEPAPNYEESAVEENADGENANP